MSLFPPSNEDEKSVEAEMDRPSRHGAMLGLALAELAKIGRQISGGVIPEPCLTCAYREGTVPNQCAGTQSEALNCTMGIVPNEEFACHHGMQDGKPTRRCTGYLASLVVPEEIRNWIIKAVAERLQLVDESERDEFREQFDAWWNRVDPAHKMDVYQIARAYERDHRSV